MEDLGRYPSMDHLRRRRGAHITLRSPTCPSSSVDLAAVGKEITPAPTGGDFDQKDGGQGSQIYLPVLVEDALVFFGNPHAAISDGIITGTGIECSMNVRARINLLKDRTLERPIIAQGGAVHFVGVGRSVEEATAGRRSPPCRFCRPPHRPRPERCLYSAEHRR